MRPLVETHANAQAVSREFTKARRVACLAGLQDEERVGDVLTIEDVLPP